jgi:hypothetical protein
LRELRPKMPTSSPEVAELKCEACVFNYGNYV